MALRKKAEGGPVPRWTLGTGPGPDTFWGLHGALSPFCLGPGPGPLLPVEVFLLSLFGLCGPGSKRFFIWTPFSDFSFIFLSFCFSLGPPAPLPFPFPFPSLALVVGHRGSAEWSGEWVREDPEPINYGKEGSRTPKSCPEQLAIVLTYQCKLFLIWDYFL